MKPAWDRLKKLVLKVISASTPSALNLYSKKPGSTIWNRVLAPSILYHHCFIATIVTNIVFKSRIIVPVWVFICVFGSHMHASEVQNVSFPSFMDQRSVCDCWYFHSDGQHMRAGESYLLWLIASALFQAHINNKFGLTFGHNHFFLKLSLNY
jgi:hypothetical protein